MISTVLAALFSAAICWWLWAWVPRESSRWIRNLLAACVGWRVIETWSGWSLGTLTGTGISVVLLIRAWRIALRREAQLARDRHEAIR
jgi:hypothetical protein